MGLFGDALVAKQWPWMTPSYAIFCQALGAMFDPVGFLAQDQGLDGDAGYVPGWGVLFDVERCPTAYLPYLAQFVGVTVPAGTSDAQARALIRAEGGLQRGKPAAIRSAIQRSISTPYAAWTSYLAGVLVSYDPGTGVRYYRCNATFTSTATFDPTAWTVTDITTWYRILERTDVVLNPNAWRLTLVVRPEHLTPVGNAAALEEAVETVKPGGIVLAIIVTDSPFWTDATLTWTAVSPSVTWDNVSTGNV